MAMWEEFEEAAKKMHTVLDLKVNLAAENTMIA